VLSFFRDQRIGNKLFGAFVIMLTMTGTVAIVALVKMGSVNYLISHRAENAVYARTLTSQLIDAASALEEQFKAPAPPAGEAETVRARLDEMERLSARLSRHAGVFPAYAEDLLTALERLDNTAAGIRQDLADGAVRDRAACAERLRAACDRLTAASLRAVDRINREVDDAVARAARFLLILLGIASLTGLALALALGLSISGRILQITRVSREVARGNFDVVAPVSPRTDDEVNELSETFNRMTSQLSQAHRELEGYSRTLQQMVAERTRELRTSNLQVKNTMERLEEANQQLVQALRVRSEFLANMSHELCTPLNAIIGFSEVLADGGCGPLSEEQTEYVNDIHQSASHLLRMIQDLLELSKIEAGRTTLRRDTVNVFFWLFNSVKMVAPMADRKNINMELDVPEDIGDVYADQTRLNQIITNLYTNAIKFTDEGGRVLTRAWKDERNLNVSVRDSGIGIPPEHHDRIFDAFEQLDTGLKREGVGSGLGLALVKNFVTMHGGDIEVESAPGEGTCFTFTIPLATPAEAEEAAAEAAAAAAEPAPAPTGAKTVLVSSANPSVSDIVDMYLHEAGYRVEKAPPGRETVGRAAELATFAVIQDIDETDRDAWRQAEMLTRSRETRHIPLIILVANPDKTTAARARRMGAVETLIKPLDRFSLICALANLSAEEAEGDRQAPSVILVAESDPLARRLEGATLRAAGYEVREAEDGDACIQTADQERPDVIVIDIDLPPTGAFDTIVDLRRQAWAAATPLVVLAARPLTEDEESFLSGKVLQVIRKDVTMKEELTALLNHLFAHIQLQSSSEFEGDFGTWHADYPEGPPPT
jgi:signal transduction histidine kinase/DNA-binding response OmpR family regulator